MGRVGEKDRAALLQRRAREQALRAGTDVENLRASEPVQFGRYGSEERSDRQPGVLAVLRSGIGQPGTGWGYDRGVPEYPDEESPAEELFGDLVRKLKEQGLRRERSWSGACRGIRYRTDPSPGNDSRECQ